MSHLPLGRLVAGVLTVALASVMAMTGARAQEPVAADVAGPHPSHDPLDFLQAPPKPSTLKGKFSLVGVGELLYSRPMADRDDPELQKVLEIVRAGDVAIANREGPIFDAETFSATGYGHGMLWGDGSLGRDTKAMGIDMVTLANNHSTDWGEAGLLETQRLHEEAGIVTVGAGRNLQEARRAGILDTPQGRIALVGTASTFKANATANDAVGMVGARPGISTLRTRTIRRVDAQQMAAIRKLASDFASTRRPAPAADAREVTLGDQIYRLADTPGLAYEMDLYDHAGLLKAVRDAKEEADLVVFTIHAHESPTGMDDDTPTPPDFLMTLFRNTVDAGADVVLGHGPHSMRGIEIYKGKPIFYGMGVFFINGEIKALQESMFRMFPDASGRPPPPPPRERSVRPGGNPATWYDSVVAVTDFEDGKPVQVRLYPLDVGNTYDRSRRGIPHLADPENARRILADVQRYSEPFGTRIEIEDNIGIIRIH